MELRILGPLEVAGENGPVDLRLPQSIGGCSRR